MNKKEVIEKVKRITESTIEGYTIELIEKAEKRTLPVKSIDAKSCIFPNKLLTKYCKKV